MGLGMWW